MDQTFFPIHPQILRIDDIHSFNVYTKSVDCEYALFHPAGKKYTSKYHNLIFDNSLSHLYVDKKDASEYYTYLENILPILLEDLFISTRDKAYIAHELLITLAIKLFENVTEKTSLRFINAIKSITDFVLSQHDAIDHLIQLTTSEYDEYSHPVNVGIYAMGLAKELLDPQEHNMTEIFEGFFLHDIGKYMIPKKIYQKKGPLTDEEWIIMKKHPENGCELLKKYKLLTPEKEVIVSQHHERHNGTGYPKGLKGDQIHTYSKICSIADTFDALSSQRLFRKAQTSFEALGIMKKEMKKEFDSTIFMQFVLIFSRHGNY